MVATSTGDRLEETAHDLFEVFTQLCLAALRGLRRVGDLKEVEYLTLSILQGRGTVIVGDIQRQLGILPAQMSRVIRALETHAEPLIACQINPSDKRKIDVVMTDAGKVALGEYQAVRERRIIEMLQDLNFEDQASLVRLLEKIRGVMERSSSVVARR